MQDVDQTLNLCFNKKKLVIEAMDRLGVTNAVLRVLGVNRWELLHIITCDCHDEVLNLEYHRVRLVLTALNQTGDGEKAANELGLSVRTVYRIMRDQNIKIEIRGKKKYYYIADQKAVEERLTA